MSNLFESLWPWRWCWPLVLLVGIVISVIVVLLVLASSWLQSLVKSKQFTEHVHSEENYVFTLDDNLQGILASIAWRRWRLLRRFASIMLSLTLLSTLALAARPARVFNANEQASSRDIVLCLDVSGSTLPYDREVLRSYMNLVDHFQGERIGLSIFNSTSRTVFPLTDDYNLVKTQLKYASDLLDGVQSQNGIDNMQRKQYQQISDWLDGTQNRKNSTSLIGDGLVSCAAMLPGFIYGNAHNETKAANRFNRTASIVLATDNVVSGKPTYTLQKALILTQLARIKVDGLYSGSQQSVNNPASLNMKSLIEKYGGAFLTLKSDNSIESLVKEIEKRHSGSDQTSTQSALSDDPGIWTILTILSFMIWLFAARSMKR
ncbi:vWA domain-containing protein [Gardnerella sp. 2492-Sm]|uniref:vWA domain-containing protein n=1 Tax=unclassified Gardnerella TaxID=2628112 RepID=UPI003D092CF1